MLSAAYRKEVHIVQNSLDLRQSEKEVLAQDMSQARTLELQLYFHVLIFLDDGVENQIVATPLI